MNANQRVTPTCGILGLFLYQRLHWGRFIRGASTIINVPAMGRAASGLGGLLEK